ncbi:MAG: tRNA (adenosine(37)-N6)-threonylcarbamoyltransferase complex dimerization subunit type 1 TsaB [Verrucomicrobiota bacterium]
MSDMILAIETSTKQASLALLQKQSGEVLWQAQFESDRLHNAKIFDPVAEALEICRGELNRIVVGLGPGNYSGIRVGISVANGLALALDMPVIGLASIAVLAEEADFVVCGDARRSSYYLARIQQHRLQAEPDLMDHSSWLVQMEELRQQGLEIYSTEEALCDDPQSPIQLRTPQATALARQVAAMDNDEWDELTQQALQPVYLRAPYITQPKQRPGDIKTK